MQEKETVFVGRRAGVIFACWSQRPTMMDVPVGDRTQDADLVFEELPHDHADVLAFRAAPPRKPAAAKPSSTEGSR